MTQLSKYLKRLRGAMTVAALTAASTLHAAPVGVDISAATITAGLGYGVDDGSNGENGGSLLGLQFLSTFVAQAFTLTSVGQSATFDLFRVTFNELDTVNGNGNANGNVGIREDERDNLGVTARLFFNGPTVAEVELSATVTTMPGLVGDAEVDYRLAWDPVVADFGSGGRYRLSLQTLEFSAAGSQTVRASVEKLASSDTRLVAAVPEPASIALVGAALAGLGFSRRRKASS